MATKKKKKKKKTSVRHNFGRNFALPNERFRVLDLDVSPAFFSGLRIQDILNEYPNHHVAASHIINDYLTIILERDQVVRTSELN